MTVYRIRQSHLTLWHIVSNWASGRGGIMGNEAACVLGICAVPSCFFFLHHRFVIVTFLYIQHFTTSHENLNWTCQSSFHTNKINTAPTPLFTCRVIASVAHALNPTEYSRSLCHTQGHPKRENPDWFMGPRAAQGPCNMTGIRYLLFQVRRELLTWGPEFLAEHVVARSQSIFSPYTSAAVELSRFFYFFYFGSNFNSSHI